MLAAGVAAALAGFAAPTGLRLGGDGRRALWALEGGPRLRGAVLVQRRVYRDLDGPRFLGPGLLGPPVTGTALGRLARAGANLVVWSGPGPFRETAPFETDPEIAAHIGSWLDRCHAEGLFTVLAFRSGPGRSAFAFHPEEGWYPRALYDDSLWRVPEKQDAWIAMVRWAGDRFGSHPALAGILAMAEPNGDWLGHHEIWPAMAERLAADWTREGVPLLLSPDGWADIAGLTPLRERVGPHPVLVAHSYAPRAYTHQSEAEAVAWAQAALQLPDGKAGDWACLEFGAVNHAPAQADYLTRRIAAFESAGANWSVFRWSTGWSQYEAAESAMTVSRHAPALNALRAGWTRNQVRPR